MKEYCNPLNLDYKFQHYGATAHREAADPTLVRFKGRYYLFASMSAGFYVSDDLTVWVWHENRDLELYHYAPDARANGDWLYFCASDSANPCTIWRTQDPLSASFERVAAPLTCWDPNLFFDDDGRAFLYWGCSNKTPIYGIELDLETMLPLGERVALIDQDMARHGWERGNFHGKEKRKRSFPMNLIMAYLNRSGRAYMEGAYMNKWRGKYYLQYAAPGTEAHVYGDGCYIADHPLGPFTFQPNTPFSFRPQGFITAAGHGSTLEDEFGNLWHASTMRISVHQNMERRIGLFPAGLDSDGLLFCNQNFADYPIVVPDGRFDPKSLSPKYMLLSYQKSAAASGSVPYHPPELALNEDIRNWWCANGGAGAWYCLDLGKAYLVHSVQINFAEEGIPALKKSKLERSGSIATGFRYTDSGTTLRTRYTLEGSLDGTDWRMLHDASGETTDRPHPYIVLPEDSTLRYVRVTALELPYGAKFALSGLRVFGLDNGEKPAQVRVFSVEKIDPLTCRVRWNAADGATGYNMRYGISPDQLYTSYQSYETCETLLTALNTGQEYWARVDSFNENGVTEGAVLKL